MVCNVKLLTYTQQPVRTVAAAARLCYSPATPDELFEETSYKAAPLLAYLLTAGHLSPFEHASFTFAIDGISRVATHQLVRHRVASYSQQSQRYVQAKQGGNVGCICPDTVAHSGAAKKLFEEHVSLSMAVYNELLSMGIPSEDARFILPHGWSTSIVVTMNARELRHFFAVRLCKRAQWEIRALAGEMLRLCHEAAQELFVNAGPPCIGGACRELRPCGEPYGSFEEILKC